MNDLRFALRQFAKQPGFTAIAIAVLALGIGANSAIFTLINAFLFKPIVAHEPERLVGVYSEDTVRRGSWRSFSHPNFSDLRRQKEVFDGVFAMVPNSVGLTDGDTTKKFFAMNISANYFSVLGTPLQLGRDFNEDEETKPSDVVIASDRWWRARGADPAVVGRTITVNGRPCTVVGITARGFCGTVTTFAPDFYVPLSFGITDSEKNPLLDRRANSLLLVGRLKEGLALDDANARLRVVSEQMASAYPDANKDQALSVASLPKMSISTSPQNDRSRLGAIAGLLLAMASTVLLIACLNLANMLLARGIARKKEIAVRLALGAGRRRIIGQLLGEGLLLAIAGGIAGIFIAVWGSGWLAASLGKVAPAGLSIDTAPDWRVLVATLGFCFLATLFFALGSALRLSRLDVNRDLKEQAGEDDGGRRGVFALKNILVVGQVALSLGLLVSAGLFGRGAFNAMQVNPGFDLDRGFYLELDAGLAGYDTAKAHHRFGEILDQVGTLSGVEAASYGVTIPFGDMHLGQNVQRAGSPIPAPLNAKTPAEGAAFGANFNVVGPDYFRTMGTPLLRGREFNRGEFDTGRSQRVAIINPALAKLLWPDEQEVIGKLLQSENNAPIEVVGIAAPQRSELFSEAEQPMLYVPYGQDMRPSLLLHVRVGPTAPLDSVIGSVREAVRRVDANLPVLGTKTLRLHLTTSIQVWFVRMGAVLFGAFGAVALLLSVIGVYGVKAYSVARRTREIGIRMALGAGRHQVLGQILSEGFRLVCIGLVVGLAIAALAAKALGGFLYDVSAFDPAIFLAAPLILLLAALLACWVPARRASRVDPMKALRGD